MRAGRAVDRAVGENSPGRATGVAAGPPKPRVRVPACTDPDGELRYGGPRSEMQKVHSVKALKEKILHLVSETK